MAHLEAGGDLRPDRGGGAQRRRTDHPLAVPASYRCHRRPRHRAVGRAAQAARRDRHPRHRRGVDAERRPAGRDRPLAATGAGQTERRFRRRSGSDVRRPVPAGSRAGRPGGARLLRRPLPLDVVLRRTGVGRGRPDDLRAGDHPPPARARVQDAADRRAARRRHCRDGRPPQRGGGPARARRRHHHARHHQRDRHSHQRQCAGPASRCAEDRGGRGERRVRRPRLPGR